MGTVLSHRGDDTVASFCHLIRKTYQIPVSSSVYGIITKQFIANQINKISIWSQFRWGPSCPFEVDNRTCLSWA